MRWLLLAAVLFAQDAEELVRGLGSESLAERDESAAALVRLGAPALPALKAALAYEDPEVRERAAAAIREIRLQELARKAVPEPARLTIDHDGTLGDLLREIARRAGVELEIGQASFEDRVTLRIEQATLFEALDRACAGRADCTWMPLESGAIRIVRGEHPRHVATDGAFRARLWGPLNLGGRSYFGVRSDAQKPLAPLAEPRITVVRAFDRKGRPIEVRRERRAFSTEPTLARLELRLAWRFALTHHEASFDSSDLPAERETGGLLLRVDPSELDGCFLATVSPAAGGDVTDVDREFDSAAAGVIDREGRAHAFASMDRVDPGEGIAYVGGVGRRGRQWRVWLPDGVDAGRLVLRVADRVTERGADFVFEGLDRE